MVTLDEVLKIQEENPEAVFFFKRTAGFNTDMSNNLPDPCFIRSEDHYIESLKEKETKTKEMIKIDNYV